MALIQTLPECKSDNLIVGSFMTVNKPGKNEPFRIPATVAEPNSLDVSNSSDVLIPDCTPEGTYLISVSGLPKFDERVEHEKQVAKAVRTNVRFRMYKVHKAGNQFVLEDLHLAESENAGNNTFVGIAEAELIPVLSVTSNHSGKGDISKRLDQIFPTVKVGNELKPPVFPATELDPIPKAHNLIRVGSEHPNVVMGSLTPAQLLKYRTSLSSR
jgi:hypothetical protein